MSSLWISSSAKGLVVPCFMWIIASSTYLFVSIDINFASLLTNSTYGSFSSRKLGIFTFTSGKLWYIYLA